MSTQPDEFRYRGIHPHPEHPWLPEGAPEDAPLPRGTWINLQDLANEWSTLAADLASRLTLAPLAARAFQGIGQGFVALSHEESAYAHYWLLANRLRYPPSVVAEGLEQTLTELHEAYVNWVTASYWFEHLANEVSRDETLLELVRSGVHLLYSQSQRLYALLLTIADEQVRHSHRAQQWKQEQGWHAVEGQEAHP